MSLHTDLPIYKKGCDLVQLAFDIQPHAGRAELANVLRGRGHAVKGDFSKLYRKSAKTSAT